MRYGPQRLQSLLRRQLLNYLWEDINGLVLTTTTTEPARPGGH